jgi:hypothetical protein
VSRPSVGIEKEVVMAAKKKSKKGKKAKKKKTKKTKKTTKTGKRTVKKPVKSASDDDNGGQGRGARC